MVAMWMTGLAMAGAVYVNGTPVDPRFLAGITLERVDVKVDAQGNLFINAPGYKVEIPPGAMPGGNAQPGMPAPGGNPAFAPAPSYGAPAPSYGAPAPAYGAPAPSYGAPAPSYGAPAPAYGAPAPAGMYAGAPPMPAGPPQPYPNGIPRARWWLVTEDKISIGHSIEVIVNGQVVQTVKSGEAQRIIDIGLFLRPGANQIECKAFSAQGNNGMMYVYLGSGQDQQGTVKMDPPQVQFGVGTNTTFMSTRSYTLNVQ